MKNKSLILNICLASISALALIFLALPFMAEVSGYDFLKLVEYLGEMEFIYAFVYVTPLITLILSILLLVSSVLGILCSVNVIKSEKLAKVIKIVNIVITGILVFFAVVTFIIVLVKGGAPKAGMILNLILFLASLTAAILNLVWKK